MLNAFLLTVYYTVDFINEENLTKIEYIIIVRKSTHTKIIFHMIFVN